VMHTTPCVGINERGGGASKAARGGMLVVAPLYHECARRSRRGVGDAVLQNSTVAICITVYYHQSVRCSKRGRVLCYAHHRVFFIIINQSARRRLRSRRVTDGDVLRISPCTIIKLTSTNRE
jgi:hypothetical protein